MGLFNRIKKKEEREPKPKARYEIPPLYKPIYWLVLVIVGVIFINFIFFGFGRAGGVSYLWLKFMEGLIHLVFVSGLFWLTIGLILGYILPKPIFMYKLEGGKQRWCFTLGMEESDDMYTFKPILHSKPIRIQKEAVAIVKSWGYVTQYYAKEEMIPKDMGEYILLDTPQLKAIGQDALRKEKDLYKTLSDKFASIVKRRMMVERFVKKENEGG